MNEAAVRNAKAFQDEEQKLQAARQWDELVKLYEARAAVLDEVGRERLLLKAGEVAQKELGKADRAEALFVKSFEVRRSYLPAIGALRKLHAEKKDPALLKRTLALEIEATKEPRRLAALHHEQGKLVRDSAPEEALKELLRALDIDPKAKGPLADIEAIARKTERWRDLVKAYQTLGGATEGKEAAVFHFLAGTVLEEHVKAPDDAGKAFLKALELGPKDAKILGVITRFFEKRQEWTATVATLSQHLDVVPADDVKERGRLLKRMAYVCESCLNQPGQAVKHLQAALELAPGDADATKKLLAAAEKAKDWKAAAQALENEAELPGLKDAERGERLERAADFRDQAAEGRLALKDVKRSLELRPKHPKALKLLEKVTFKLRDWPEHLRTLEVQRELLDPNRSPAERTAAVAIQRKVADVAEKQLKDDPRAIAALQDALRLEPKDDPSAERLEALLRKARQWAELAKHLERRAAPGGSAAPGAAATKALRELANVRRDQLEDPAGAAKALDQLLAIAPQDLQALRDLAPLQRTLASWEPLARTQRRLVELEREPAAKAGALRGLAEVLVRQLKKAREALEHVDQALQLEKGGPGASASRALEVEVARALGDDGRVSSALTAWSKVEAAPANLRKIRFELAGLEERRGNAQGALAALEEVLAEAPADPDALPAVVRLLVAAKRVPDAEARIEAALGAVEDGPATARVATELARLAEGPLEDPARAREAWERALRADPDHPDAFPRLVALSREAEAAAPLADALEDAAPRAATAERRAALWREAARLLEQPPLQRPDRAVRAWERVRSETEQMGAQDAPALAALRRLYRPLGRWGELADLVAAIADTHLEELPAGAAAAAGLDPAGLRRELAEIADEHLEDLPRAAAALEVVLGLAKPAAGEALPPAPATDEAWELLASVHRRLDHHADVVRVLLAAAEAKGGTPELVAKRLVGAAEVQEGPLGRLDEAAATLKRALEVAPRSRDVLARMARVQASAGQHVQANQALLQAAEVAAKEGDAAGAATLHVERGHILDGPAGDGEGAEAAFAAALAQDPRHGPAHEALVAMLRRRGRWEPLERALLASAQTYEGRARAPLLVERGEVLAHRLGRLDDALAAFDEAEQARPKLAAAREARVKALRPAKRPAVLAAALAGRRAADPPELTPEQRLGLIREEAELRAFALEDLAGARTLLLEARKLAKDDVDTLRLLLRVERRLGLGAPLAEHLEQAAGLEPEPARKADLLIEAARVRKARENDAPRARALLEQALAAAPDRIEAVRWLSTIAREANDKGAIVTWMTREAELEPDTKRQVALWVRLAGAQRKDPAAARAAFEQALAKDPDALGALRGLAPLLRAQKAWAELAAALERLARLEPDTRLRVERLVALGEVRLLQLKQVKEARQAFDQALELGPRELRALRGRARTISPTKSPQELVDTLKRELEVTPRADQKIALGKQIAELQRGPLKDLDGAAESLEEVIRLGSQEEEPWRLLRDIHLERRDWLRLAATYEAQARRTQAQALREERLRQAVLIVQYHLKDKARAAALYEEILALGDPQVVAVPALPKLLQELGKEAAYESVLARIRQVVPNTRHAANALVELARRSLGRGDRQAAARHAEAALGEDARCVDAHDLLIGIAREADDLAALSRALERKREAVAGEPAAVELRLERASLLAAKLGDLQGAVEELKAAAREAPGRRDVLERLAEACRKGEWWAELAHVLGALAKAAPSPAEAAKLLEERARVERDWVKAPRAAIASLRAAYDRRPGVDLLDPLIALYEGEELWDELVQAYEERARLTEEPRARAGLIGKAALVLDARLRRGEDAVAAWERALDLAPDDAGALRQLQALCVRTKNRRGLAEALVREAAVLHGRSTPEAAERLAVAAVEAAKVLGELTLEGRAVSVLEQALEKAPRAKPVIAALEAIHTRNKDAPSLYALLERVAAASTSADEQAALHERMARLSEEELKGAAAARGHWEKVLALKPASDAAFEALRRLLDEAHAWADLARVLRVRLSALGRGKADAARGGPASDETGPARRKPEAEAKRPGSGPTPRPEAAARAAPEAELPGLWVELADVLERRLERSDEAVEAYGQAAALAPEDPRPLLGLERIHQARSEWAAVVRVRQQLRQQEADPRKRAELALKIADACERLSQRDQAITALREALEEVPDNAPVLALLRRFLLEAERWPEAAEVLSREADVARERATQLQRRLERAALLRDQIKDERAAVTELERARTLAPLDPRPLDGLAPLLEARGDRAALAEVLEARAALEPDGKVAADLWERAASQRLALAQAGADGDETGPKAKASAASALERAGDDLEKALRRDPQRPGPLDGLEGIYRRREAWADLARTLHRRAALARASGEDKGPYLTRAAQVEEQRLNQQERAAVTLEELLEDAPGDVTALAELARLRGALGEDAAHVDALGRLAALSPPAEKKRLLLLRAKILEKELHRPAAAAQCVAEALELSSADKAEARALAGQLVALARAAQDASLELDATEQALAVAADAADQAKLMRAAGELAAGPVYRAARAIELWEGLYQRDPRDDAARRTLEQLYVREARWKELHAFFGAEAKRLGSGGLAGQEVLRLKHRQADLLRGVLADPRAAEAMYREILAADPTDRDARAGLEALYRAEKQLPELAALLAEKAARAQTPLEAAQALYDEAAVHEERGDAALALERLEAARERGRRGSVGDDLVGRILRGLVRLHRAAGRKEQLAQALAALAGLASLPSADRAMAQCELGMVLGRELGRTDEAVPAFERALALDAQNVPAARALAQLHRQAGRMAEVVKVYELEAGAKIDKGRLVWLRTQIGQIRHDLGDLEGAAKAFQDALALEPSSLVGLRGLAGVARELADFRRLATALEALAELSPSPVDRLEARRELARIYEEALADVRKAVATYRKVLADAPDDLEAVRGLARGLRSLGDEAGLADALEAELGLVADTERRRILALEASRIREELGEKSASPVKEAMLGKALAQAREASELAPDDAEALGAYARVAEKLGRWAELADVTVKLAHAVDDTVRSGWMLRKAAKLRALRLSDARGAVTAYREAVAVNPGDQEAWEALEPLAVELEDDGLLLEALERILTLAKKEAQRAQVALKLGRQRMKMGLVSEAIAAFTLARELARGPLLAQALEALEGAYRLAGRAEELARVLEERAADGKAPNARDLLLERASLLEERLGRHDLAIECLQKLLTLAPDDARVGSELERLLSGQRRWEELTVLYEQQATRRGARGYDALVLLGRVLRDQLDAPERAAKALQRAVALNPAGLEAVEALRDLYTRTEQWAELLDALRLELGLVKGARQRESRLRRAGHLAEEKLGDLLTAARLYAEASQLAPKDKNLLGDLARVQEARGDYAGLIETLRRDLALTTEAPKTLELHKRLGQVHATRLFKRQDALECYRQALAVDPTDKEALAALTDLLRDLGAWDELAQVIERRLGAARGKEATLLRLELARVQAEKLGRPDQAIAAAEEVLTDDPRCVEAVLLQVQLHRRFEARQDGSKKEAKQHDASFARALRRLATLREGTERAAVLVELAGIQRRSKGDEAARPTLLEAFKADPAHEPALEQLTNLFTPNNQWDELLATLEAAAKAATTEFRRGELLARTAELLEVRRKDPAAAEARYREALALSPTHLPALRGLARVLQSRGVGLQGGEEVAAEALARLEEQVAELEQEPREKALALVRAGDVRREALGQLPHARRHYEQALARSPELFSALAGLAELAWAQDDVPAAVAALERVAASPELAKEPERGAELLWVRGQVLEKARRLEQAAASYRRAVELRPDHLQALEDLGRLCVATEGWAAARGVYEELVARTRAPRVRAEHQLALARVTGKLGDVDKAVALFEEGLQQVPKHPEGRLGLGELLKAKDPKGARRQFEMALAGAPPAVEVQARLALADLFEGPLGDAEAAAGHLQVAAALEGAHRARSHRRLAEILGRQEKWNDAVHHLTRAAELEPEPRKQAELMANVARVVRDRLKQRKLARKCFHQAFSLNPHDRHTLDSLLRLLEADGDLEAQARALGTAADVAREGRAGDEAALRLRRAEVLVAMKRPRDAAGEYERIMAIEPRHAGSRAALSRLYVEVGDVGGVERIHRELLAEDPLAVESFRALHDVWKAGGRADERAQTAQVLSVLKAATDEEEKVAKQAAQKVPSWRGKVTDDAFVDHVLHPRLAGPLGELVRAAREVTTKQVPDDLKSHGIGWLTKSLPLDGDAFPEHRLVKQVAELLDVGPLELYWMADWRRPEPVIGHGRNPGLILCPEVFSGLSEPEKAFVLGRALGPLKVGLEPLRALSPDQLRLVLLGVLKGVEPARTFKGDDDKLVKAVVKAVGKTDLARDLARVHEALWRGRETLDLEGLRQAALLCGSRTGLLAAGGLLPAARAVFATNLSLRGRAPETTEAVVKELKDSPELKDLLGWAVSPGHLGLRARLLAGAPAAAGGR